MVTNTHAIFNSNGDFITWAQCDKDGFYVVGTQTFSQEAFQAWLATQPNAVGFDNITKEQWVSIYTATVKRWEF